MPSIKVNGIVARYADYKDYDRMLTLITDSHGLVGASSRGCRRPKSRLMQSSELFVYGEFVLFKAGDKYTVDSCDVRETFYPLREDYARLSAGAYMLSVALEGAAEEERADGLLELLLYALSFTAYGENEPADMAICFAAKALSLMGYRPSITRCAICGRDLSSVGRILFSGEGGGSICRDCALARRFDGTEVSALSLEALRRMLALDAKDIKKVRLPESVRAELKGAVNAFAESVLEKKLKPFDYI